jgi:hypothetical protein
MIALSQNAGNPNDGEYVTYLDHVGVVKELTRLLHETWQIPPNEGGIHHDLCACDVDTDPAICEPDHCPFCSCWRLKRAEQRGCDAGLTAALETIKSNCHRQRHAVAGLGHVVICPPCYDVYEAMENLRGGSRAD